jgi:hypothetical protein
LSRWNRATVAALSYDEASGILQLEFRSRAVYRYFGVPVAVHESLLRALSRGKYFNRVIRGHFPYAPASRGQVCVAGKD